MSLHSRAQPALAIVVAVAVFVVVTRVGVAATASVAWTTADMQVVIAVNAVNDPVLSAVAAGINVFFGPLSAALITLAAVIVAGLITRSARPALRVGLLIALPWGTADLVKALVRRPRPDSALLPYFTGAEPTTFSYPSGHTAFAVALTAALVVSLWAPMTGRVRAAAVAGAVVVIVVTAWSRMYLGVHYPTDVVAAIVIVPASTWAVAEVTRRMPWFAVGRYRPGGESARQA